MLRRPSKGGRCATLLATIRNGPLTCDGPCMAGSRPGLISRIQPLSLCEKSGLSLILQAQIQLGGQGQGRAPERLLFDIDGDRRHRLHIVAHLVIV